MWGSSLIGGLATRLTKTDSTESGSTPSGTPSESQPTLLGLNDAALAQQVAQQGRMDRHSMAMAAAQMRDHWGSNWQDPEEDVINLNSPTTIHHHPPGGGLLPKLLMGAGLLAGGGGAAMGVQSLLSSRPVVSPVVSPVVRRSPVVETSRLSEEEVTVIVESKDGVVTAKVKEDQNDKAEKRANP